MDYRASNYWAVILGGSSGFGLATAKKLASQGMNICVVHRDRRGAMSRIEGEFEQIRAHGVRFIAKNLDALSAAGRNEVIGALKEALASEGAGVRVLLHSIALGSVKLIAPLAKLGGESAVVTLADKLGTSSDQLQGLVDQLFLECGKDDLVHLSAPTPYDSQLLLDEEELAQTIYAMGTSLLSWTRALHQNSLFCSDARVIGLTSEGNSVAWRGYAAVGAAKCALEAISRSIAVEFAPFGIRSNILQPGVTDTPALRLIPGNARLMANAKLKNPFHRLTTPEDVANVVAILATDEGGWINGSLIRVDGGEHIAG